MTLVVPYSFVPGTKAKASEVNANFNDVLTKIENTNKLMENINSNLETNITASKNELESKIQEAKDTSARPDLSNITPEAQGKFDVKANVQDIDGYITCCHVTLAFGSIITVGSQYSFNISAHLPNDGNKYFVFFNVSFSAAGGMKEYFCAQIQSDIFSTECAKINTVNASYNIILPVGPARIVNIFGSEGSSPRTIYLFINGYRKVR